MDKYQMYPFRRYFVMAYHPNSKKAVPLGDENGDVSFYPTYRAAEDVAKDHPLCKSQGYEIFAMIFEK